MEGATPGTARRGRSAVPAGARVSPPRSLYGRRGGGSARTASALGCGRPALAHCTRDRRAAHTVPPNAAVSSRRVPLARSSRVRFLVREVKGSQADPSTPRPTGLLPLLLYRRGQAALGSTPPPPCSETRVTLVAPWDFAIAARSVAGDYCGHSGTCCSSWRSPATPLNMNWRLGLLLICLVVDGE